MNRTNQKLFTVILDETGKLKERDIVKYLHRYFQNDELNRITYIRRYVDVEGWQLELSRTKRIVTATTLKDLVIDLLSNDSYLNELVGGLE